MQLPRRTGSPGLCASTGSPSSFHERGLVVMSRNHHSTRLSHDELVGVKCRWERECLSSQARTFSCLWVQ
jgi:hypothetical protein